MYVRRLSGNRGKWRQDRAHDATMSDMQLACRCKLVVAFERPYANCYSDCTWRGEVCSMLWGSETLPRLAPIGGMRRSLPPENQLYRMVCKEE